MPLLREGDKIRDTYEIERFLGEGAFAEVYRVQHRYLGRQAMKVFKKVGMTPQDVEAELSEALLLSRIGHPNIVRVFDANTLETENGTCGYFTMEYVPGGTLHDYWKSFGRKFVPKEAAFDLTRQVCLGLSVAHRENPPVIHRDIKPQNILVGYETTGLRARLSDFGLAKRVSPLTLLASAAGTLCFKPPEVFEKGKTDSCAADVYALGVTLYLLLSDELPYEVDPALGWGRQVAFDTVAKPPSFWNPELPREIDAFVSRCIALDPTERYPNAMATLEELQKIDTTRHRELPSPSASLSRESSKHALGPTSELDAFKADALAQEAVLLARNGRLADAADKMEEAMNNKPSLRNRYASRIRLWRNGISM